MVQAETQDPQAIHSVFNPMTFRSLEVGLIFAGSGEALLGIK
jgi:hypothetical protein